MAIKITSKLSKNQRTRLYRAAQKYESEMTPSHDKTFMKIDSQKNCYAPMFTLPCGISEHDIARHMMVCAKTTFDYEIF